MLKVALIASFYTSPLCVHSQTVCQRKCIVALVAFVWFFSTVFSNAASNCLYYMKYNYTRYMITCWNGFSPECGVVVFYVISQNFITYLPHQMQLRWHGALKFLAKEDAKSQLLHWFGMTYNTFSFMLTKTSMYVILKKWSSFHKFYKNSSSSSSG